MVVISQETATETVTREVSEGPATETAIQGVSEKPAADRATREVSERGETGVVEVYLAEEQPILREAYSGLMGSRDGIRLLDSSSDTSAASVVREVLSLNPQVVILGVKGVRAETVETVQMLRQASPGLALVLLFARYDLEGIKTLREVARGSSAGCAYLLKHTIDTVDQLTQAVKAVAHGQVIIDSMVMKELIKTTDGQSDLIKELSPKAMEVLGWMARGYRNDAIAEVMSRDVKTVEKHINTIYGTLQSGTSTDESRHPRVNAALTYLRATGQMVSGQLVEEE